MHSRFDYARVHEEAKVGYRECKAGYLRELEGPEFELLDCHGWMREEKR